MKNRIAFSCFLCLTVGCASAPRERQIEKVTVAEVLAGAPFNAEDGATTLLTKEDVFSISPEMKSFLDKNVDLSAGNTVKLRQLAVAIINDDTFGLEYDDTTRTASETFRERQGNCLSFTNMFVVMARYLDLDVYFQEVDIPPDWTRDSGVFVLNRHVNVFVDLGLTHDQVVDFNIEDLRSDYDMSTIADTRAMAHFDNNLGVERMLADDEVSAFQYFRRAIVTDDRGFSPAWTNLATLYLRKGLLGHAETAYHQALRTDRMDFVAMSNLAGLYQRLGDSERAKEYKKKVSYHRKRNPYYRHILAKRSFYDKDYDAAIDHLKYAIRKRPKEDQFYSLLALSYLKKEDPKSARYWFARAAKAATLVASKKRYSKKIEFLQTENN